MKSDDPIIGLGTGRCGTLSLSTLLNAQRGTRVIHEGKIDGERHLFGWESDSCEVIAWLEELRRRVDEPRYGDVGSYFLPHVEAILHRWPGARFVVLQRDREATVQSFLSKVHGRNHWMKHDGSKWCLDPIWDPLFPTFDAPDVETAIGRYWDLYYQYVVELSRRNPGSLSLHGMDDLNSTQGQQRILSFLEYDPARMVMEEAMHENKRIHWAQRLRGRLRRLLRGVGYRLDKQLR